MLIIPVEQKPDLRNPPWATLFLILINCLVFFLYQSGDDQRMERVMEAYQESQLIEAEGPLYLEYLKDQPAHWQMVNAQWEAEHYGSVAFSLLHDLRFEAELHQNRTFQRAYSWKLTRQAIEQLRDRVSYIGYGFIPAEPSVASAFVSMFLHADIWHLFGNMVFLFIFGFMLEAALGRWQYVSLYLLSGLGATALYWMMEFDSYIYGVGASGAIAGLMGMYLALYGVKKIKFFYWIGPYFNYFKAPALLLFPFWVGKELFGQLTAADNVNYWAHAGGLIAGCLLVFAYKKRGYKVDEEYLEKVDELAPLKEGIKLIDDLIADLALDQAKVECHRLLREYPDDLNVLHRLYKLLKNSSHSKEYYQAILHIFKLPASSENDAFVYECFLDCQDRIKRADVLSESAVAIELARRFLRTGYYAESLALVRQIVLKGKKEVELPPLLFLLAKKLKDAQPKDSRYLVSLLVTHYPESEQALAIKKAHSR